MAEDVEELGVESQFHPLGERVQSSISAVVMCSVGIPKSVLRSPIFSLRACRCRSRRVRTLSRVTPRW